MLEAYAGPDAWRAGVRAYMAEHAYGNATSDDLWRAIDKAAGKPVSTIARDFTTQPGVPLIHVATTGGELLLTERRLASDAQVQSVNVGQSEHEIEARNGVLSWRAPVRIQSALGRASCR